MLSKSRTCQRKVLPLLKKRLTRAVWVNRDQSIMSCATTQGTGTRIQSTLHLGPLRRVETSVETAIRSLVTGLEVAGLTLLVRVVLNEKVPRETGILRDLGAVGRNSIVDVGTLVVSSFDEESLVASEGKTSGKRAAK